MDTLVVERYRQIVERVLREYARIPYSFGEIQRQVSVDRDGDHFLLMAVGWNDYRREHGCIIHIDIIDGKLWIQRDGSEEGIARDLEAAGVPKEDIVLAFKPPEIRKHTGYAVA
jgi:hypothetical protein